MERGGSCNAGLGMWVVMISGMVLWQCVEAAVRLRLTLGLSAPTPEII
jgi:hypothetical protein